MSTIWPNVIKGNHEHKRHFEAIRRDSGLQQGWEQFPPNTKVPGTDLRPDWFIYNPSQRMGYIIDLTSKYEKRHYRKGLKYVDVVTNYFDKNFGNGWTFVYIEDYWLNAVYH